MGDTTVLDLPLIGDPDIDGRLATFLGIKRTEAASVRAPYINQLDPNLSLYLYGTLFPGQDHVINKVQGTIHAFSVLATKTPPVLTLKVLTVTDGGEVVLTKMGEDAEAQYNLQMQVAAQQGQPVQPFQPNPDQQAILDSSTVTEYMQSILDSKMSDAGQDEWYRDVVRITQINGWAVSQVIWDDILCHPVLEQIPLQQWYIDPTASNPSKWQYVGVDWPMDAQEAKRILKDVEGAVEAIDEAAMRTIQQKPGAQGYSNVYQQPTLASPFVTMSIWYFRNHEAKMSLQDGINNGILEIRTEAHDEDESEPNATGGGTDAGDSGGGGIGGSNTDVDRHERDGAQSTLLDRSGVDMPDKPPPSPRVFHIARNTAIHEGHELWPMQLLTRRVVSVASGADVVIENSKWKSEIPVVINYNINVPFRPFGQGEPQRLASPQTDTNSIEAALVTNAIQYGAPTVVTDKSAKDELAELSVTTYSQMSGRIFSVDVQASGAKSAADLFTVIPPPTMPPALLQMAQRLDTVFDDASGYSAAQQGQAPTDNASGKLVDALQTAGMAATEFKLQYLETMMRRTGMICLNLCIDNMEPEDYFAVNRTFSLDVIETKIIPYVKSVKWDVKADIAGGGARATKEAAVRQDFQLGIIDRETAQEKLQYDVATIKMREQQQQMAAGAVPGAQPQQPNGSFNGAPQAASNPQGLPASGNQPSQPQVA